MMNNNFLMAALSHAASIFAGNMQRRLSLSGKGGYPSAIASSILIDPPQPESIDVRVGGKKAKMAMAFEYGSGIRATRGKAKKYPIRPRSGRGRLRFMWYYPSPLGLKYIRPRDERVSFRRVMHPGIAPRPFVKPSIEESVPEMRKVLARGFKAQILVGVEKVTVIEVK